MVTTRFAPSPTGLLHLGNVRTALLNWLYARKHHGRFLLRFEDTDTSRSQTGFIHAIEEDLDWLGLNRDGETRFQSAHSDQHRTALEKLADKGLAYRCFCTEAQISMDHKLAASRRQPPRYAGRCRKLSQVEAARRAESEPFVWRLAVRAETGEIAVNDLLRGMVHFSRADMDDPVAVRSDGSFTFLLPNAIDDVLDGITHVLRGDDHLTNTACQAWLLKALGHEPPAYLHHGLLLDTSGAKLSKRSGGHDVKNLREQGLLPAALVQTMVRLGHPNLPGGILDTADLARHFEAGRLSTSSVKWVDDEMWRWHARVLHMLPADELAGLIAPIFPGVGAARMDGFASLVKDNLHRVEDAAGFGRLLHCHSLPDTDAEAIIQDAGIDFFGKALTAWRQTESDSWQEWMAMLKETSGCRGRSLFLPLRVVLTGAMHGPEMARVVAFLGRDGVKQRLEDALEQIRK